MPKAVPYGIYDLAANTGWVSVGCDGDTAAFAVETLRRWWHKVGQATYPKGKRLLVCADVGGSNGYRVRLWKIELAKLATEIAIPITICHFPPGTSKWNKLSARLRRALDPWKMSHGRPGRRRIDLGAVESANKLGAGTLGRRPGLLPMST